MIPLKELFRCQVPGTFVGGIPRKKPILQEPVTQATFFQKGSIDPT
jgi:hypothetical protein